MSRSAQLRDTFARCEDRARQAERAFSAFASKFDANSPAQVARHHQLSLPLEQAERDAEWAKEQMERALDIEGLGL